MKNARLISVALALVLSPLSVNALMVENISVSDTGGISVSGEASASGSADASASIRNVLRAGGSGNTRIEITSLHGAAATSVRKTIGPGERFEITVATSPRPASVFVRVDAHGGASSSKQFEPAAPGSPGSGISGTTSRVPSAFLTLFRDFFAILGFF